MPGWVYKRPFTEDEKLLRRDRDEHGRFTADYYPWTSISTFEEEEKLGHHSHHSDNTHLIIEGTICFERKEHVHGPEGRDIVKTVNDRYNVKPGVAYKGHPVDGRCRFVEGHRVLSPATRNRFWMRGDIEWSETAEGHQAKVSPEVEYAGDVTDMLIGMKREEEEEKAREKTAKLSKTVEEVKEDVALAGAQDNSAKQEISDELRNCHMEGAEDSDKSDMLEQQVEMMHGKDLLRLDYHANLPVSTGIWERLVDSEYTRIRAQANLYLAEVKERRRTHSKIARARMAMREYDALLREDPRNITFSRGRERAEQRLRELLDEWMAERQRRRG